MDCLPAASHDFWIEPKEFNIQPNFPILAELKVGEHFKGSSFPYLSNRFVSFTLTEGSNSRPITGDHGDTPAVNIRPKTMGLKVITYLATADQVTFDRWAEFVSYVEAEGLDSILESNKKRGLPLSGFSESYIRCGRWSKSVHSSHLIKTLRRARSDLIQY